MMAPKNDRERLADFVQLIGAEPREVEFDETDRLVKLNLAGLNLTELPGEIGQFTALKILKLSEHTSNRDLELSNRLSRLPKAICKLQELEFLNLSHNQIASLPDEFARMTNLKELHLHDNQLTAFPQSILEIENLNVLGLTSNKLTNLPTEIKRFVNLKALFLGYNSLSTLPPEMSSLAALRGLFLHNNQFCEVPLFLTQLSGLEVLTLSGNSISDFPEELSQLINLNRINLDELNLQKIPKCVWALSNLRVLYIQDNQLSVVQENIDQLVNLQELYLNNNQLNVLPESIGHLAHLQRLYLHDNQLTGLPESIGRLTNLKDLTLGDNPLRTPPPEIVIDGLVSIQHFLSSLQSGKVLRHTAKLLIIGEGGIGKTSLLRSICNQPFDASLITTHGIAREKISMPHPTHKGIDLTLNIWDFGGQQIYHTTHQFFMTRRSLYLLVWNARGDTEQGRLDHWLRNIQVLAPDAPVLLVATHNDERKADFHFERFQKSYPQIVGWLGVSNKTGEGIGELRQRIASEAAKLPLMEQQWPTTWAAVETALQADQRYHIDAAEFKAICTQNGVERESEQATLGGYLHDLGHILYFQDDDALSDFIVLKPNWLTQTMARVLDDEITKERHGVLDHSDFARLWDRDDAGIPYERRLYPLFLRLLERFLISYELEKGDNDDHRSLVPLLLPHAPPVNLIDWATVLPDQPEIRMVFNLKFTPPGLMSWFIVLTHHYTRNVQWREGVRLTYQGHEAEVTLNPSTGELWLRVRGPAPWNFFNILQHTVNDRIIGRYFTGLQYERRIPCLCHKTPGNSGNDNQPCSHYFDYNKLVERKQKGRLEVECDVSYAPVSVVELLEGIHYTTNDRIEAKLDAGLAKLSGTITKGQRKISKKIDATQQQLLELQQQNRQFFEQLNRDFTRLWNLERDKLGSETPSLFLLMPGGRSSFDPRNLIERDYTLCLLCQHPGGPHLVKGESGYSLPRSHKWWGEVAPWLREVAKYLKYIPKARGIVEAYDEAFYKTIQLNVELFSTALDVMPDLREDGVSLRLHEGDGRSLGLNQHVEAQGSALRALQLFLKEADKTQRWATLRKVATNDGNLFWLCPEHVVIHNPY